MSTVRPSVPTVPPLQRVLCPYCGEVSTDPRRCDVCRGHFDPLSRQATQNAMGPWFIRDESSPFRPGCSIETLRDLIRRGKVTRDTIIRGPGTKQFWNFAGRTPSIANLLGLCHNCRAAAKPDDYSCRSCGAVFSPDPDRQHLGLAPVHMLPGEASPEIVAAASLDTPGPAPVQPMVAVETTLYAERVEAPPPRVVVKKPVAVESDREGSLGKWLLGITVVLVLAMGGVFALVATGTISIPWLTGSTPAPAAPAAPRQTPPPTAPPVETPASIPPQPTATGEPGPTAETTPPSPVSVNLNELLGPMLAANPFNENAMLAKIEELRRDHPTLEKELDAWAKRAKDRALQLKLRDIP